MKRKETAAKAAFFADQILKAPKCCENCGAALHGTKAVNAAAIVAHILPKSKVKSVALHPMNKFYGCMTCHHDYDNKGAAFVQNMPIFPTLVERVAAFYDQIDQKELRHVPEYFRPK